MDQARMFTDIENGTANLQVISATTADELLAILNQLQGPVKVKTLYASGNRHYCWFSSERKVILTKKTKKKRGKSNGRLKG